MSSSATVTVLYPAKEGYTFDMDYYLKTHMPLVTSKWTSFGLKQYYVTDLRNEAQPYSVQATLIWDDLEGFAKGGQAHGAEVMGDIKNFSSEQPIIIKGGVLASKI
ncbi:hypothetical protein M406DRAFT_355536 [Cryphonectria parasitica EP155]|uniref:EthD domain-containing protein n=1 Tax=Cryphonectria parasitica (strain ATCC 38755 / EP155) TaxID=660469 RepID=A0A9P4Y6E1_CRYP1|nr:uncharacterized protein M406DRAFT_355536 [Cryphonectria parasitica EP155]KAF3767321.1 hypothetical protein M406DRAFT_355536 [Cryphonectria parasitica EP155]